MAEIDFNQFTLNNEGIKDLNKVAYETIFKYGNVFDTCTPLTGVTNGQKAGYVSRLSEVGWKEGQNCKPEYKTPTIKGREATWSLGKFEIPIKLCYKNLMDTIAKYGLKQGTDIANLEGTAFWDHIFMPLFKDALERMYWRVIWFNDTAAKASDAESNPGDITAGVDTDLLNFSDGFWKKLKQIANDDAKTVSYQTANGAKNGTALNFTTSGVATDYMDKFLEESNSLIKDGALFMTNKFYRLLVKDYRKQYSQTIPFYEVANGVSLPHYDGVPIKVVKEWDEDIAAFENKTSGNSTALVSPTRLLYANPKNLLVGTSDKTMFGYFRTWFSDDDQDNKTLLRSDIGTIIESPTLVHMGL